MPHKKRGFLTHAAQQSGAILQTPPTNPLISLKRQYKRFTEQVLARKYQSPAFIKASVGIKIKLSKLLLKCLPNQ